jgi:hydrogenase nickel incorporation protein HypA/HybF
VHEFSIADALADQVRRHAPPGQVVRVEIVAGALRGLEPEAMRLCWEAVTADTPLEGSVLDVDLRPWTIWCDVCGRRWESPEAFVTCACGNASPLPDGSDELRLVAISVEEAEPTAARASAEASP